MRLLFIRFSSIGDIVLTTPAIRCAKNQIPGVEIHFLTKLSMKDLVIGNPHIDVCHFFDEKIIPFREPPSRAFSKELDLVRKKSIFDISLGIFSGTQAS